MVESRRDETNGTPMTKEILESIDPKLLQHMYDIDPIDNVNPTLIIFNCSECLISFHLPEDLDIVCNHWRRSIESANYNQSEKIGDLKK